MVCLLIKLSKRLVVVYVLALLSSTRAVAQEPEMVRLVVEKLPTFSKNPSDPAYHPILETGAGALGFSQIADYSSFGLYEGPSEKAAVLVDALKKLGNAAQTTSELDAIHLRGHEIHPGTGLASPAYPPRPYTPRGSQGLYLLALRGYPLDAWVEDLSRRGVILVEPLPPSAYIAYGSRAVLESLRASTPFVRGVVPMTPQMKTSLLDADTPDASPYRTVVIESIQPSPTESLIPYLESVAAPGTVTEALRLGSNRVHYTARMTDVDIQVLGAFDTVFAISPSPAPKPSSERQGVLCLQPAQQANTGQPITLPPGNPSYTNTLAGKGIDEFDNTRIALLDTGFDNGDVTAAGIHPDFVYFNTALQAWTPTVVISNGAVPLNQTLDANVDNISHGTLATSIVTGFAPANSDRLDIQSYRYGLGLAPTVQVAVDKFFARDALNPNRYQPNMFDELNRLNNALGLLAPWAPNVINHSWNGPACTYTPIAQRLDIHTRTDGVLHTVSAGNANEVACFAREPGTAKNVVTVGATENFTLGPLDGWTNSSGTGFVGTCAWNNYPGDGNQDARHIPTYSASARGFSTSVLKPDMVAPGSRVTGPLSREQTWRVDNGVFCNRNIASPSGVEYGFSAGTSFAAPAAAGAAAVVRRWYRDIRFTDPSPAMTKAILINGARNSQGGSYRTTSFSAQASVGHIPNIYQGWGMLNFDRLLGATANYLTQDQQTPGLSEASPNWIVYPYVVDASKPVRLTLVWTDRFHPTTGAETYSAVNNLNALVCYVGGFSCWRGNHFLNGVTRSSTASSTHNESVQNVEHIIIPAGNFSSGQQIYLNVNARTLNGDMDPNCAPPGCTRREQDFAMFGENVRF